MLLLLVNRNVGSVQLVHALIQTTLQSETTLTGISVILAPTIAMTFTHVILLVQTETVYLHVQPTTRLRPSTLQLQDIGLAGSLDTLQSTETNTQVTVNNAFRFSELTCNVTSNSITNTTTINLRANVGNTGVALSIGANGIFTDNTRIHILML